MSEKAVTGGQVADHLSSVIPEPLKCPVCGSKKDFLILSPSEDGPAVIAALDKIGYDDSILAYVVSCNTCGFIWQFRVGVVNKAVQALEDETENSNE